MSQKNLERNSSYIVQQLKTTSEADGIPYVFISYASDDWKIVLEEIVRPLEERGLRVYYDKAFGTNQENWIDQFTTNMKKQDCIAVLAFLSESYYASYATLMELMYSQSRACGLGYKLMQKKPIIPILISSNNMTKEPGKFIESPNASVNLPFLPNMERSRFNEFYRTYIGNNQNNSPEHALDMHYLETLYSESPDCQNDVTRLENAEIFSCIYDAIAPNYLFYHNYGQEDKGCFFDLILQQLSSEGHCPAVGEPVVFQEKPSQPIAAPIAPPPMPTLATPVVTASASVAPLNPMEKMQAMLSGGGATNTAATIAPPPVDASVAPLNPMEKMQAMISGVAPVANTAATIQTSAASTAVNPMEALMAQVNEPNKTAEISRVESDMSLFKLSPIDPTLIRSCLDKTLVHIVIPEGIEKIDSSAFNGLTALETLVLPSTLKTISLSTFNNLTSLQSVTFREGIEKIQDATFQGCTSLKEVILPNSLQELGQSCFENCVALERIVFPEHITSIPSKCCCGCTSLPFVHIPSQIERIGSGAFWSCTALETVELPDDIFDLDLNAFENTAWQDEQYKKQESFVVIGNGVLIHCQLPKETTHIDVPEGVFAITENTFQTRKNLISVNIPESVKWLTGDAFTGCENLREVSLPSSLTRIGKGVFTDCKSLSALALPPKLEELGVKSFLHCESLRQLEIPVGVSVIPDYCFQNCRELERVTMSGVTEIQLSAFENCAKLVDIQLPNGLEKIDYRAFGDCSSLSQIELPETIKVIENNAFLGCTSLLEVYFPPSITKIGNSIFGQTNNIKNCKVVEGSYAHTFCQENKLPYCFV